MPNRCEVCGNPIRGEPATIEVDGGIFRVCGMCSNKGKPVKMPGDARPPPPIRYTSKRSTVESNYDEHDLELRIDFNNKLKIARNKMGISQEELGRRLNEKLSVIKHLESGSLKPDDVLTRKLERFFKIQLLVPEESEE
jgi:putative transcription factor